MKAWEVRNGNLGLHDVSPANPHVNETVVRVSHVGICGSDRPKLLRPTDFSLPEPWRPGHEIVGTNSTGCAAAVNPPMPCGKCLQCNTGNIHLCAGLQRLGWNIPGGFAEQVAVPVENVYPLPDGFNPLHATLADPAAVAIHGLRCHTTGEPGQLAVIGAGVVGLLTACYAHEKGWKTTVIHRNNYIPHKTITKMIPATFRSLSTTYLKNFDLVIDAATGTNPTPLNLALYLVRDGGTIIVQNAYHPDVYLPVPLRDLFRRSIHLIGSFSFCRKEHDDFTLALNMLHKYGNAVACLVDESGELHNLHTVLINTNRRPKQVLTVSSPSENY